MALTKIITDTIDLSSDTTALKMPKGTTAQRPDGINIDYLIVAGGGGGAGTAGNGNGAGGGGAGGLLTGFTKVDGASGTQTFDIEVGLGGAGGASSTAPGSYDGNPGVSGSNSIFSSFTAIGGGGGGNRNPGGANGANGGSGGGSGCYGGSPYSLPGSGTSGQGNDGGTGEAYAGPNYYGGVGGGAGTAGSNSAGGNGVTSSLITTSMATTYSVGEVDSSTVYFAGGGGGGRYTSGSGTGTAGLGGGGTGGTSSDNKTAGTDGTGGGGGGASWPGATGTGYSGADGGNGVIILSTNEASAVVTAGVTVNGTAGAGTRSGLVNGDKYVYIITVATAGDTISFTQSPGDVPDTIPVVGTMRENTTTSKMEIYTGAKGWRALQQTGQDVGVVPSNNFKTVLYTGNSTSGAYAATPYGQQDIELGFTSDLSWFKTIGSGSLGTTAVTVYDVIRGDYVYMNTNSTYQSGGSGMPGGNAGGARLTNGVTVGDITNGDYGVNGSSTAGYTDTNYVSWNWKAGGAAVQNNDGSINGTDCMVSANADAGFSMIKWTGSISSSSESVGHGLGKSPELVILKNIDAADAWYTYVEGVTGNNQYLKLNTTDAVITAGSDSWGAGPTSSVMGLRPATFAGTSSQNLIMYCWTSIPGYSLIGKYTGTGTTDFPIIYTGFTPAWLMIKRTDSTGNWCIYDNKRDTTNPNNAVLVANSNNAQSYYTSGYEVNFYNNGFQIAVGPSIDINTAGGDYIFMCFAS